MRHRDEHKKSSFVCYSLKNKLNIMCISLFSIRYSVSQGSVLGPQMFLLYINNLNKAVLHSYSLHTLLMTQIFYM